MTAFAQNPDPSKWQKGQNVVADLGMGDVNPTEAWTTKSNGGTAGQEGKVSARSSSSITSIQTMPCTVTTKRVTPVWATMVTVA